MKHILTSYTCPSCGQVTDLTLTPAKPAVGLTPPEGQKATPDECSCGEPLDEDKVPNAEEEAYWLAVDAAYDRHVDSSLFD